MNTQNTSQNPENLDEFEVLARNAADDLLDEHGMERHNANQIVDLAFELGTPGFLTYEDGLVALVRKAVEIDRRQRGLTEAVAEVLAERGANAAAQLVRDTDPDDDLWTNYFGPMLDELERDYTTSAHEISET